MFDVRPLNVIFSEAGVLPIDVMMR
ncbi:MAG: hypothetical protein JWO89_3162, partial [Verrucomicrobiaceae bacterium]|nr:hypothetical protein [Verrucomicrobiaceae bacterium]